MKLYQITNGSVLKRKPAPFPLEKDIQALVEGNTQSLFDLEFVCTELSIEGRRFDTLCFDRKTNAFVIIEYKKSRNYSVIDQGYTYLSILLNNKADFVLEFNETKGEQLKRSDVDWSQTRILFISPEFTEFQKTSVNFQNIPFELWEIQRFEGELMSLNKIVTSSEADINTTAPKGSKSSVVKKVSSEIIVYDENYHLYKSKSRPDAIVEMYHSLKSRITELGAVECHFGSQTIDFIKDTVFAGIIIHDGGMGIVLNVKKGQLQDYKNLTEDVSEKGHWGKGDYQLWINGDDELDYAMELIRQSYNTQ